MYVLRSPFSPLKCTSNTLTFHLLTGTSSEHSPAKFHPLLPANKKEITTPSTRCRTNLLLGIPPKSWSLIHSIKQPPFRASIQMVPPWRQHFLAHYLSLIWSNFLHDKAHIKNILGWYLRSDHSFPAKKFLACFQRETISRQFQVPVDYSSTSNLIYRFLSQLHYPRTEIGKQMWYLPMVSCWYFYPISLVENPRDDQRNLLLSVHDNVKYLSVLNIWSCFQDQRIEVSYMQKWFPDSCALWSAPLRKATAVVGMFWLGIQT